MSVLLDQVAEVRAAIAASPDPKALRRRLLGELRTRYPDVCAQARSDTDAAVFDHVLFEHPDIIERIRTQILPFADLVEPMQTTVEAAMTEAFACIDLEVTQAMGKRFTVKWPEGSSTVKGPDGRRWRVEWPTDQTAADLTEL